MINIMIDVEKIEIGYVRTFDNSSVTFQWGVKEVGFGELSFHYEDGKLKCQNEYMTKEFAKKILCEFVEQSEFTDNNRKE